MEGLSGGMGWDGMGVGGSGLIGLDGMAYGAGD